MSVKRVNTKKMMAWTGIALVLAVLSALCLAAAAQETAEGLYKKGQDLWMSRSYEEAAKAFDKAIELDPSNAEIWDWRGYTFLNMVNKTNTSDNSVNDVSKYNEAVRSFDKAIEIDPKFVDAIRGKGDVFTEMHKYEEAVKAYEKALEIDPENVPALNGKGRALAEMGKESESADTYDESIVVLDKVIETANTTQIGLNISEIWLEKGFVLQDQGRYDEAVKALDNATEIDPQNLMAWKVKGVLLLRELKMYEEAASAFDKALQINPKDAPIWKNKGDALRALGRHAEADEAYAKARELGYKG